MASMRARPRILAFVVLFSSVAGCMSSAPEAPSDEDFGTPHVESAPTLDVSFEDCWENRVSTKNRMEWVAPLMPEGFRALEFTPGFANAELGLLECDRVVLPNAVRTDVKVVLVGITSRKEFGEDHYQAIVYLIAYVSDASLHAAFVKVGVPAVLANVTAVLGDVTAGNVQTRVWRIEAEGHAVQFDMATSHVPNGVLPQQFTYEYEQWFGGPPHVMCVIDGTETPGSTGPMRIGFEGESTMNKLYGDNNDWYGEQQERWNVAQHYRMQGGILP